jgi:hypothetical protein
MTNDRFFLYCKLIFWLEIAAISGYYAGNGWLW